MPTAQESVELYRKLAEEHQRLNHPQERDRFLLLAADAAWTAGKRDQAEQFRRALLAQNPNHLLKPYNSLADALTSQDILAYVQQLRRSYPPEKAGGLLKNMAKDQPSNGAAGATAPAAEEEFALPMDADRGPAGGFTPLLPLPDEKQKQRQKEGRVMAEREEPLKPVAGQAPAWRPTPAARPGNGGAPAAPPNIFGLRPPEQTLPRGSVLTGSAPAEMAEPPAGGWVGGALFFVVLLAALALLVYAVGMPFLPPL